MSGRLLFASGLTLFLFFSAFAEQPPEQRWVARYDGPPGNNSDYARALAVDNSGNIYVTGGSIGSGTGYDYATIKYDPNGNQFWVKRYNYSYGDDGEDQACALAVDSSGNVYVTGYGNAGNINDNYATIKYDPNGNQLWIAGYNTQANGTDRAKALAVDSLGNVYVTGVSYGSGTNYDYATIKYNPSGNWLWVARYNGDGNNADYACAIALDNSGNVYVTGYSTGSGTGYDYATIKYGPNGNQLWVARYNGPGNSWDKASALAIDNSGNVYVTGNSMGSGTGDDYTTIKYDPNGNQLWAARYSGPFGSDFAHALVADGLGNVYVTGQSANATPNYDYATVKYDPNGNQLWAARYNGPGNGSDIANALAVDSSGNVYVTGESMGSGTSVDYATVKYDPNGNQLWLARYNGLGNYTDYAKALAVDELGNIYVTGNSYGNGTYDDYATIKYTQHDYCTGAIEMDLNGDCKVDFADFAVFAEDWLGGNDWLDLAMLADKWLDCNFALQEDCW